MCGYRSDRHRTRPYAMGTGADIFHAVGFCAMGPESDASVLLVHVAGNTQAPTMAVAWIGADLILEDS